MSERNGKSRPESETFLDSTGLNGVSLWLIQRAAHRAPESLSLRLEEEWRADWEARSYALSRLRFAMGCCWAMLVIAHEYPRTKAAVTAGGLVTLFDRNFAYFSQRSGMLFLIAALHAALFYGLMTTLSHTRATLPPPILENQMLKDVPREKVSVPQSLPRDWTITVPKLNVELALVPSEDETTETTEVREKPIEPYSPPVMPTHVVARVAGGPGTGFPDAADFYPSQSIRLGEQGISTVRVCVDHRGRLTSDPTTVQGSGSARLDQGALKLARAASGHYRASTEDGQPVDSCYPLGIRFQLKN